MTQPQADRNLLFGVLAFQLDIIGRDQLITAMHAWVLDKQQPLGQILVEHKALREGERTALEVLVDRHLERHDEQPQGSLGALSIPPELRWDLGGIADAELQASLARLPTVSSGETPFQPAGTNTGQPTSEEAPAVGRLIRRRSLMAAATALLTAVVVLAVGILAVYREHQRTEEVLAAESEARRRTREALDAITSQVMADWLSPWGRLAPGQRDFLEKVLAYYESFASESGDSEEVRHGVADAHRRIGNLCARLGRHEEAEAAYRGAQELYPSLAADFPSVPKYRQERAWSHYDLGLLLSDTGRPKEAEAAYRDALDIQKPLATDFPGVAQYRQDLAQSHSNLGILLAGTGRAREAEASYRAALTLYKQLTADFPAVPQYRHGLAVSHNNLGLLFKDTGRPQEAEAAYRDALDAYKQLAADSPTVPDYQGYLANAMARLAEMLCGRKDNPAARQLLEQAQPHLQAALDANPRNPYYREVFCDNRQLLATTLLLLGEHGAAAAAAADLARVAFWPAGDSYKAACFFARCIPLAEQDARLSEARREELAKSYGGRATEALRQALAKGYQDAEHLKKDKDLDPLRSHEDFKKLLAELDKDKPKDGK
jgi:tetratricopeptide (TPR) repeat protein